MIIQDDVKEYTIDLFNQYKKKHKYILNETIRDSPLIQKKC